MIKIKAGSLNIHEAPNGFFLYGISAEEQYTDNMIFRIHPEGAEMFVHAMGTDPYIGDLNEDPDLEEAYGFEIV